MQFKEETQRYAAAITTKLMYKMEDEKKTERKTRTPWLEVWNFSAHLADI